MVAATIGITMETALVIVDEDDLVEITKTEKDRAKASGNNSMNFNLTN